MDSLYPHARGANPSPFVIDIRGDPLPPRTWGKRGGGFSCSVVYPSTPTHVGQTGSRGRSSPTRSLYPHARGANDRGGWLQPGATPLPPRTWGKLLQFNNDHEINASTPTHVGQTRTTSTTSMTSSLYPHARGANVIIGMALVMTGPLPPRTWGKRCAPAGAAGSRPSTPTHVGQTLVEPQKSAGAYSPITRFSFTVSPPASSGTRHTPSKTTGPATTSSKTTVR